MHEWRNGQVEERKEEMERGKGGREEEREMKNERGGRRDG